MELRKKKKKNANAVQYLSRGETRFAVLDLCSLAAPDLFAHVSNGSLERQKNVDIFFRAQELRESRRGRPVPNSLDGLCGHMSLEGSCGTGSMTMSHQVNTRPLPLCSSHQNSCVSFCSFTTRLL